MVTLNTDLIEEELYGGGYPLNERSTETRKLIRSGPPHEVDAFWRYTLRPIRNNGCAPSIYGTDVAQLAIVKSNNFSNCQVSPMPRAPVSYILLYCDGNAEFAFTPSLLGTGPVSLQMRLGEGPITEATNCTPRDKDFNGTEPFLIRQIDKFYYISQGLVTDVVNRCDFTKINYEIREKKPLTIAFTGLTFHVDFTPL